MTGRSVRRVAVLADVHGNAPALAAVLRELEAEQPELLVVCGDLTWGSLPEETWSLIEAATDRLASPPVLLRGNAERSLLELAARAATGRPGPEPTDREAWLVRSHTPDTVAALSAFVESAAVDVAGLGPVRFCHGSPRSDEELITVETPEPRMRALLAGVLEQTLVSAHTHMQFDRRVVGVRSVNPGSVGMPYEGRSGAFWALLGPDVELRRTEYDLDETVRLFRSSGDPLAERMVELLLSPPAPPEVIAHAEGLEFSG